ncbi:MAG: CDP-diacylglycerol--serine O-phosphatidyltransferase [Proteobacteria bacterium]|nr:MAG: CDP-diacylglycerol--serine O-phosphatidyltransferase [Pseudomonadota bacterium]
MDNANLRRAKGSPIYLIPSMITLSSMCCGFYAMVQSIAGDFFHAGLAIFFSMILDSLDGRIARLTHTSSPFGAELDSLADMVAFGAAPAMIAFNWGLHHLGKIGWLVSFVYCACAALRLARFNVMIGVVDKRYFQGMPSPSAAALVVGFVYMAAEYHFLGQHTYIIGLIVTLIAGLSMVSNIKFYSFKEFHFHHTAPFRTLLFFLALLVLVFYYPDIVVYSFFVLYTIVSYIFWVFRIGYKQPLSLSSDDFEAS